ncbi:hypothetical protein, partial [Bacillus wiedmannii]|uniref:hypothetical protein n=1 Tax=Bacillus wiedmannii TaxID=1890302 RepID=UPI002111D042
HFGLSGGRGDVYTRHTQPEAIILSNLRFFSDIVILPTLFFLIESTTPKLPIRNYDFFFE